VPKDQPIELQLETAVEALDTHITNMKGIAYVNWQACHFCLRVNHALLIGAS
jgi:hypothetical protein